MRASNVDRGKVDWLRAYAAEVATVFGDEFDSHTGRFKGAKTLLQRFNDAVSSMLSNGSSLAAGVDEAHNELCVASKLLANANPRFTLLEYEPILTGCAKSIDFRARTDQGLNVYVDVKTIKPKAKDRWEQFEKAIDEGRIPEHVNVLLSESGLGGELWHNMFAARSRMLEHALGFEAKIRDCSLVADDNTIFILAFCGDGWHWPPDELEDFVDFYRTGSHRPDDPLSQFEAKYIADKDITLDGTITRFACISRSQLEIRPRRVNWKV